MKSPKKNLKIFILYFSVCIIIFFVNSKFLKNSNQDKMLIVSDIKNLNNGLKKNENFEQEQNKNSKLIGSQKKTSAKDEKPEKRKQNKRPINRSVSSFSLTYLNKINLPVLKLENLDHLFLIQNLRVSFKDSDRTHIFESGGYYFYEEANTELSTVIWDKSKKRFAFFSGEIVIEVNHDIRDIVEAFGVDIISEPLKNKYIVSVKMLDDEGFYDFLSKLDKIDSIKSISLDLSYVRDRPQ